MCVEKGILLLEGQERVGRHGRRCQVLVEAGMEEERVQMGRWVVMRRDAGTKWMRRDS